MKRLLVLAATGLLISCGSAPIESAPAAPPRPATEPELTLPSGLRATVFHPGIGRARHIAVRANGDVYVTGNGTITALRDTDGDGRADREERFGEAGTGIAIRDGWLYAASDSAIRRWRLVDGELVPPRAPETIVADLPAEGHAAKGFAFDASGTLYVAIGSPSNACQADDRSATPGKSPCDELARGAGVWRFSAEKSGQTFASGTRFATGLRNPMALAWNPDAKAVFTVVHGRDQLSLWPGFTDEDNAELPAEEMHRLTEGLDGGWPTTYWDGRAGKRVLAPEYGGDGKKTAEPGRFADPVVAFPAHWAPNDLLFYTGTMLPERYRGGAFVAFHGSWNRAPLPQQGYKVAFVPFASGRPSGPHETFADGFAGPGPVTPRRAAHRPCGLAQGPDGALWVVDSAKGRVWRIAAAGR